MPSNGQLGAPSRFSLALIFVCNVPSFICLLFTESSRFIRVSCRIRSQAMVLNYLCPYTHASPSLATKLSISAIASPIPFQNLTKHSHSVPYKRPRVFERIGVKLAAPAFHFGVSISNDENNVLNRVFLFLKLTSICSSPTWSEDVVCGGSI